MRASVSSKMGDEMGGWIALGRVVAADSTPDGCVLAARSQKRCREGLPWPSMGARSAPNFLGPPATHPLTFHHPGGRWRVSIILRMCDLLLM